MTLSVAALLAASVSACSSGTDAQEPPTNAAAPEENVTSPPVPEETPTAEASLDTCVVGVWSWPQGFSEFYADGTGDLMPLVNWEAQVTFTWQTAGDHMEVVAVDNPVDVPVAYSGTYTCAGNEMHMGDNPFLRVTGGPGDM